MNKNAKISAIAGAALLGASNMFTGAAYGVETTISGDTPMGALPGTESERPAIPTYATCEADLTNPNVKQQVYIFNQGGGGLTRVSFGVFSPEPGVQELTGCVYQTVNKRPTTVKFAYDPNTQQGQDRLIHLQNMLTEANDRMCARLTGPKQPECQ